MAASFAKCRRAATLPATRRTRIRRYPETRGDGFHPRQLPSFRMAQREAFHLLLGRLAALLRNTGSSSIQELCVPGLVGAGFLGTRSRLAQTAAWRLAVLLADCQLSDD